jgi:hypothetical protein
MLCLHFQKRTSVKRELQRLPSTHDYMANVFFCWYTLKSILFCHLDFCVKLLCASCRNKTFPLQHISEQIHIMPTSGKNNYEKIITSLPLAI